MRRSPRHRGRAVVLLSCAAALTASSCGPPRGSLLREPTNPRLFSQPRYSLLVSRPRDLRPPLEREGDSPRTTLFLPLIVVWHHERRGNWISDDHTCSPAAASELQRMTVDYLRRTGAFSQVLPSQAPAPSGGADFALQSTIRHLYGTAFEASHQWVSIFPSKSSRWVESSTAVNRSAVYGNAIIDFELYDLRGGKRQLAWRRTVRGTADLPAGKRPRHLLGEAAARATRRALTAMAHHLTLAVADYAPPGAFDGESFAAALADRAGRGELRFVVQRSSARRSAIELLTIDHRSGRIVGHQIIAADVTPIGRPGDWLLSRRRPADLTLMPYREYAALAGFVARDYELRRVDEIYHYHFFGKRDRPLARRP